MTKADLEAERDAVNNAVWHSINAVWVARERLIEAQRVLTRARKIWAARTPHGMIARWPDSSLGC